MPIRPRRSQRGRVILLGAGALFVVLQLSSRILFDYCWPQVRFPTFHDQVRRFDALPVPPTILCLGSSRTGCLLKEAEIGQVVEEFTGDTAAFCFNAQLPNGDLIVSERMLRTLLERGARPRFALIELCPEGVNHRNGWLVHYVAWMLRWEDIPTYLKDMAVTGNLVRFAGTRIIPLYVYRYQIRLQLGALACDWCEQRPLPQPLTPEGRAAGVRPSSVGVTAYWQQRIAESLHEATIDPNRNLTIGVENVQRAVRDYRPGGNAAAALERVLILCRAHAIEPTLFGPPLSSTHRACYTPEIEAAFQAYVSRVTHKHGCRYLDYRDALPDTFFVDHHHATLEGGLLFSRKISLEVLAPAWHGREVRLGRAALPE